MGGGVHLLLLMLHTSSPLWNQSVPFTACEVGVLALSWEHTWCATAQLIGDTCSNPRQVSFSRTCVPKGYIYAVSPLGEGHIFPDGLTEADSGGQGQLVSHSPHPGAVASLLFTLSLCTRNTGAEGWPVGSLPWLYLGLAFLMELCVQTTLYPQDTAPQRHPHRSPETARHGPGHHRGYNI